MKKFFRDMLDAMCDGGKIIAAIIGYLIGVFAVLSFVGCRTVKKVDSDASAKYHEHSDIERVIEEWSKRYDVIDTSWKDSVWFDCLLVSTKYDVSSGAVSQVDTAAVKGGFFRGGASSEKAEMEEARVDSVKQGGAVSLEVREHEQVQTKQPVPWKGFAFSFALGVAFVLGIRFWLKRIFGL